MSFDVEVFKDTNNYRTHKIHEIKIDSVSATDTGPVPAAEKLSLLEGDSASSPSSESSVSQENKEVKKGYPKMKSFVLLTMKSNPDSSLRSKISSVE